MIDKHADRLHAEITRLIAENGDLLHRLVDAEEQITRLRATVSEGKREKRQGTTPLSGETEPRRGDSRGV
jgi:hypothetical protein